MEEVGLLAGQRPLTPAPLLLHHSAFILPGPGQAPPGVGSVQEAGAESGQLSAPGRLPCSRDCPRSQHLRGGYLYRDPKDGVEGSAHPDRTNYRGPVKTSSGDCTRPGEASLVRPQGNKGQGQTSGPGEPRAGTPAKTGFSHQGAQAKQRRGQ